MKWLIYGLVDPRTLLIRYIGRSSSGLTRPNQHRRPHSLKHSSYKNKWLRGLLAAGFDYLVVVLEQLDVPETLGDLERWWIMYGHLSDWPLTNLTEGGEGNLGWKMPQVTKDKIGKANAGRIWSEESRAKAALASAKCPREIRMKNLAMMHTPESAAKRSAKLKGRPKTPEHAAKNSSCTKCAGPEGMWHYVCIQTRLSL